MKIHILWLMLAEEKFVVKAFSNIDALNRTVDVLCGEHSYYCSSDIEVLDESEYSGDEIPFYVYQRINSITGEFIGDLYISGANYYNVISGDKKLEKLRYDIADSGKTAWLTINLLWARNKQDAHRIAIDRIKKLRDIIFSDFCI